MTPGFTLVELLMVIVVIGTLAALLLPAIGSAIRRTREATVQAEISQLATALTDFRLRFGEYPPSRVLLVEDGNYGPYLTGAAQTSSAFASTGATDVATAQLAQRSMSILRKLYPRLAQSMAGAIYSTASGWPDYNGNGQLDPAVVLSGDECLVWFLGGVPALGTNVAGAPSWSMSGLGRDPKNPFPSSPSATAARTPPLFEFRGDRLTDPDGDGYPSYADPLATGARYAYFRAYASGYDPNDCNFGETDDSGNAITLGMAVGFPLLNAASLCVSPAPNPYASSRTGVRPVAWLNAQSFQLLSAGVDGQYGPGGTYSQDAPTPLPLDAANTVPAGDVTLRFRERDNLGNFHNGRLD